MTTTNEDGFTLVELLVAIVLFSVLSVGFYQVLIAQARVADTTRSVSRAADEARLGFNRMIREVREADSISYVSPNQKQFTVRINYNGDAYYQVPNAAGDNEVITFTYDDVADTITLCAAVVHTSCTSSNTEILMAGVSDIGTPDDGLPPIFKFYGNDLEYDWNGDGIVTWEEIDDASDDAHGYVGIGNNDTLLTEHEFPFLSSVKFQMDVDDGNRATTFHAAVLMRNKT